MPSRWIVAGTPGGEPLSERLRDATFSDITDLWLEAVRPCVFEFDELKRRTVAARLNDNTNGLMAAQINGEIHD